MYKFLTYTRLVKNQKIYTVVPVYGARKTYLIMSHNDSFYIPKLTLNFMRRWRTSPDATVSNILAYRALSVLMKF